MGGALAYSNDVFNVSILILSLVTTLFLQILSNYANDYGDSQNGADNKFRKGETRAVQSGQITSKQMVIGIIVMTIMALISGIILLKTALGAFNIPFFIFFTLGMVCIAAAVKYTAGKNPYGYAGLGDVSVFIFFGLIGVIGSYYLYASDILSYTLLFPSYSCGVFSVAVLNLNNMRDILPDAMAGKRTIPVRIGFEKAKLYHLFLLISGLVAAALYFALTGKYWQISFLVPSIAYFYNLIIKPIAASSAKDNLDSYLKKMALGTLLFVLMFAVGINV